MDTKTTMMIKPYQLLIHSAKQIVQVSNTHKEMLIKSEMQDLKVMEEKEDGNGCCIVIGKSGLIEDIGFDNEILSKYPNKDDFEKIINASGKSIIPGFVDAHTHSIWAGDRVHEFKMKLAGATYLDIHKSGGGIYYTVSEVRKRSENDLLSDLKIHLNRMMECGTTTVEIKSGYGLDLENELKMLRVIETARKECKMEISSTYCGAHAVPKDKTAEEATQDILENQLPTIKKLMEEGQLQVDNIDVFCEKGVFNIDQTERILSLGKSMNMKINFHGEELSCLESPIMATPLGCKAISHLEEISPLSIRQMAATNTVGVLLPSTAFMLALKAPPARQMIDEGMIIALGSDFNPNAYCFAMPIIMHLGCRLMKLSMEESLAAATINSAFSLGLSGSVGSLEVGKFGDLVVIDAPNWEHIIYQFGCHTYLIDMVLKSGRIVYERLQKVYN